MRAAVADHQVMTDGQVTVEQAVLQRLFQSVLFQIQMRPGQLWQVELVLLVAADNLLQLLEALGSRLILPETMSVQQMDKRLFTSLRHAL
jgi:hypothetical protein